MRFATYPLLGTILGLLACNPTREVSFRVLLPEDHGDFQSADNASLVLEPDGETQTFSVQGVDFSLDMDIADDEQIRRLTLYLAQGQEPIAWGRTALFQVAALSDQGPALFLGREGSLSVFPQQLHYADPRVLATRAPFRGLFMLDSAGNASLLREFDFSLQVAAPFPHSPIQPLPDPRDGGLFPAANGHIIRLVWENGIQAWDFDPAENQWTSLAVQGAEEAGIRPGALELRRNDWQGVYLLGATPSTESRSASNPAQEILSIGLVANEDHILPMSVTETMLDGNRHGGHASWIFPSDSNPAQAMVFGGKSTELPLVWSDKVPIENNQPGIWIDAQCVQINVDTPQNPTIRVLCLGGLRNHLPTADAAIVSFTVQGSSFVSGKLEIWPNFINAPIRDPRWLTDQFAVYAIGNGELLKFTRSDLQNLLPTDVSPVSMPFPSVRTSGGHFITMGSGATFLVGGLTQSGLPVERWQVFTPALVP